MKILFTDSILLSSLFSRQALSVVMGAGLTEAETMGWGANNDDDAMDEGAGVIPRGWESTRAGEPVTEGRDWAGIEDGEWRGEFGDLQSRYSVDWY